jgi:hypothetical protein
MNDFEHFLSTELANHANALTPRDGGLMTITRRGLQRRHRRRAVVGGGLVTASIATIGAIAVTRNDPRVSVGEQGATTEPTPTIDGVEPTVTTVVVGTTDEAPPVEPITPVESGLVWNRVDLDSAEALGVTGVFQPAGVIGDGPFYAVSTSPGRTDTYTPTLYRSADALSWEQVSGPGIDSFTGPFSIAASGGGLYAVGTAPGQSGGIDAVVSTSTDRGTSWERLVLDLGIAELRADPLVLSAGASPTVMHGDAGVVIAARLNVSIDYEAFLPGWSAGLVQGIAISEQGIAAYDNPTLGDCGDLDTEATAVGVPTTSVGCVIDPGSPTLFTWAELGVSDAVREAILRPVRILHSADGVTFNEVPVPDTGSAPLASLLTSDYLGGYAIAVSRYEQPGFNPASATLLTSSDGVTWTSHDLPTPYARQLGEVNGRLVLVASEGTHTGSVFIERTTVWQSADLTNWSSQTIDGLVTEQDGPGARMLWPAFGFGSSGITAVAAVAIDDVNATRREAVRLYDGLTRTLIMHSADGVSWSREWADELAGTDIGAAPHVAINGSQVIVALVERQPIDAPLGPDLPKQILLVGTPKQ